MKRRKHTVDARIIIALLIPIALYAFNAKAEQSVGRVEIRSTGENAWRPAPVGAIVHTGDTIRTGESGQIELKVSAKEKIEIGGYTVLSFTDLEAKTQTKRIRMGTGKAVLTLNFAPSKNSLTIDMQNTSVSCINAHIGIAYDAKIKQTRIALFDGEALIVDKENPNRKLTLKKGERVSFDENFIPRVAEKYNKYIHGDFWGFNYKAKKHKPILLEEEKTW